MINPVEGRLVQLVVHSAYISVQYMLRRAETSVSKQKVSHGDPSIFVNGSRDPKQNHDIYYPSTSRYGSSFFFFLSVPE